MMKWLNHVIKLAFVVMVAILAGAAVARGCQIYADHPLESAAAWWSGIVATYMWVSISLLEGIRDAIRSLREDQR